MSEAAEADRVGVGPGQAPVGAAGERLGLARVLGLAARRLERTGLRPTGRVRVDRVSAEEVAAVSGLLGARWRAVRPGAATSIDLAALDEALRASRGGRSLVEAAQAATGARLVDRRASRSASLHAREREWAALAAHRACVRHPALAEWLGRERRSGAAARAGGGVPFALLRGALDVLAALPAQPPQTLARFAAATCGGDPHALDRDRPLDATVRRALAHVDGEQAPRDGAEERRERYERWGVSCDELSSTVLCLGLRPAGEARLARALREAAAEGQPRVVTLRELRGTDVLACGPVAFSCENPDVVAAAADALGRRCPPLVCTAGWPSGACLRLLRCLVAGRSALCVHGDMDPEGLRIVERVADVTGGRPWRMTPADHADHVAAGEPSSVAGSARTRHPELIALAEAIAQTGRLVREEQMIDRLLEDLRAAAVV